MGFSRPATGLGQGVLYAADCYRARARAGSAPLIAAVARAGCLVFVVVSKSTCLSLPMRHNRVMEKFDPSSWLSPGAWTHYLFPGLMAGVTSLVLAARELEDAGRPWSWPHVITAATAGAMMGIMAKGLSDAVGLPSAWDAPLFGAAGAVGIGGLSIFGRWMRRKLESILTALLNRAVPQAKDDSKGDGNA